ncbi:MAG: bifunctional adenosylcobinamide kinase/adenosylcobinamide-phosphate guanylyltransferase [Candidatus Hodgkinia cicadicola]
MLSQSGNAYLTMLVNMLIIGNARVGKSKIIRHICQTWRTAYFAVCCVFKSNSILCHIRHRPSLWDVFEEGVDLPSQLQSILDDYRVDYRVVVLDNIAVWIANLFALKLNIYNEVDNLILALKPIRHKIIISSEDCASCNIGNRLYSRYGRILHSVNQQLAMISQHVYSVVFGLALRLK